MQHQEQNTSVLQRLTRSIWGILSFLLLTAAGIYLWNIVSNAPQAKWRNAFQPLPWEQEGIVISEAEASWKNSKGDERMELRSFCYPSVRIKLAAAEGEGTISIRFFDSTSSQIGDRVNIPYKNGKLLAPKSPCIQATENEVTVRLEDGYRNEDLYTLHQVNQDEPYWRVELEYAPQGQERKFLGYISVIPNDL